MLFENYRGLIECCWVCAYLSLIFIKVQQLHTVLRARQTLDILIFVKNLSDAQSEIQLVLRNIVSSG